MPSTVKPGTMRSPCQHPRISQELLAARITPSYALLCRGRSPRIQEGLNFATARHIVAGPSSIFGEISVQLTILAVPSSSAINMHWTSSFVLSDGRVKAGEYPHGS